jgi:hypothetical protein
MILAEVLLGDFVQLSSNNTIARPPLKPDGQTIYDSIKGHTTQTTKPSDVFMVYHENRAYPRYLVTYTA